MCRECEHLRQENERLQGDVEALTSIVDFAVHWHTMAKDEGATADDIEEAHDALVDAVEDEIKQREGRA